MQFVALFSLHFYHIFFYDFKIKSMTVIMPLPFSVVNYNWKKCGTTVKCRRVAAGSEEFFFFFVSAVADVRK